MGPEHTQGGRAVITYTEKLAGEPVRIHALDPGDDDTAAREWIRDRPILALDVEATGLDVYACDFAVRLIQIADDREAWVLRADSEHRDLAEYALWTTPALVVHNAGFDLAALDRLLSVPLEHTYTLDRTVDTAILSRLIDPLGAGVRQGGRMIPRHGLKHLVRKHIDPGFDADKALTSRLRSLGLPSKSAGGFAAIDPMDPVYVTYAGLDAITTFHLAAALTPRYTEAMRPLMDYETRLAQLVARMSRRGILVDEHYTNRLVDQLRGDWEAAFATVAAAGLTSTDLNTDAQREGFAAALRSRGVKVGRTATGKPALSKTAITEAAVGVSEATDLVEAFFTCREIAKVAADYAKKFLAMRDPAGRLHPQIHSLGAQTGRMSISDPPLQQIPRTRDVRGCLIAEPGHVLVAADYSQVEFRVAAALADEPAMKKAIADGVDLHAVTATRLYGKDFTDEQRNVAKRAGFGRLYGAGAGAVAQQCGVSRDIAEAATEAFDATYPRLARYVRDVSGREEVVTSIGRRLPLDGQRGHIGINYAVQSEARDVFASALLRLDDAGLGDHLWLPVHDEVIVSVPENSAEEAARLMETVMFTDFRGVPVTAQAKVLGRRWRKT